MNYNLTVNEVGYWIVKINGKFVAKFADEEWATLFVEFAKDYLYEKHRSIERRENYDKFTGKDL